MPGIPKLECVPLPSAAEKGVSAAISGCCTVTVRGTGTVTGADAVVATGADAGRLSSGTL